MTTWNDLGTRVENAGNILSVSMEELRDLSNNGRLGRHVAKDIEKSLSRVGLGHIPSEIPTSQGELVRLYIKSSIVGKMIENVFIPGDEKDKEILKIMDIPNKRKELTDMFEDLKKTLNNME